MPLSQLGDPRSMPWRVSVIVRATVRGLIAAMAMTGMRTVTQELGWLRKPPPDAIAEQRATGLLMQLPRDRQEVAKQLAHWAYGAMGGATFGLLSPTMRHQRAAGPVYGIVTWLTFEVVLAPILGLRQAKERRALERVILALDHVLYGVVVASTPWPQDR